MRLVTFKKSRKSLVTLTPLIDVVFILLLFFMLTTQFNPIQATSIEVSAASNPIPPAHSEKLHLHMLPGGEISIDGSQSLSLSSPVLHDRLSVAARNSVRVNVSFDDDANIQELTTLTDLLHEYAIQSDQLTLQLF